MFEASKKEVLTNDQQLIQELQIKALSRLTAKFNLSTVIGWCKDLAWQSRNKNNEDFALKCDQIVSDMTLTFVEFTELEKELRISRQRNADLEIKLIQATKVMDNQKQIIQNMESELYK
jgi:hypothetical protein